eukprot:3166971-Alexandrium_andersonii.AAC.1
MAAADAQVLHASAYFLIAPRPQHDFLSQKVSVPRLHFHSLPISHCFSCCIRRHRGGAAATKGEAAS